MQLKISAVLTKRKTHHKENKTQESYTEMLSGGWSRVVVEMIMEINGKWDS